MDEDLAAVSYHGGIRAATELRTLVLECLRSERVAGPDIDVFINVYTKAESPNTLMTPTTKELLADSRRGFNASGPLCTPKTQLTVDLAVLEVNLLFHRS